ncbi:MAG: electron transport complex subunit E [Porticoccus sp.]|jgi:electron transport complex protein RnfE|uniref:electron transport complex subunit E n=1 Tax=Porticoccus sp. Uisw_050_02 TaxID=3230978 RepID=UPI0030A407E6|tara:strand:- start:170 stop:883 length:714 start_codon:yes stop_codon:yes gene_type:complete
MADISYKEITTNGLWKNNPALVQLLGLCPLLAVTGSVVNALGLGLATMLVLVGSNAAVSLIRKQVSDAVKIPAFVMIIATFTTCTELLMKAFTYELYLILGIFIPLIVTNCAILGRAEAFASKNTIASSVLDGLMMGSGFAIVLLVIGAIREIFGVGTIFANMDLLFGPIAANWNINLFGEGYGFLILVLPPGAFIVTGMLIALKNLIDSKLAQLNATKKEPLKKGAKRMRTTGTIA